MAESTTRNPAGDYARIGIPMLVLLAVGFAVAFQFVSPAPPSSFVLATGQDGGAYALYAEQYRDAFAPFDIQVELRSSSGSEENLRLLRTGEADVAFVQGGVADPERDGDLLSLGSLYFEPLWIFLTRDSTASLLSDLSADRVSAGPVGSGTRSVALTLLHANGVTGVPLELTGAEAATALRDGRIDAMFVVAAPTAPLVSELLADPDLRLLSVLRADAYSRRFRFLSRLSLPRGVIDFAADLPPDAVSLISPAATLVANQSLHPALIDLLLQSARRIHGEAGLFSEPGDFPSPRYTDLPLSKEATRYYENGPPFLQRFLPFWLASLVDRLKVMLIPLIALLIPLFRVFPPVYRWRVRSRIYRWYKELRELDPETTSQGAGEALQAALREVARIETEVSQVPAPASYGQELYDLRLHIDFVRSRLREREKRADS